MCIYTSDASGKEYTCQCRRLKGHRFDSWVGRIPLRRAWQPIPGFLPGESHGQRSLAGYSPWGCKELDTTEVTEHAHVQGLTCIYVYVCVCVKLGLNNIPLFFFFYKFLCVFLCDFITILLCSIYLHYFLASLPSLFVSLLKAEF